MTELNGNDDCRYGVSLPTAAQYSAKIEADMQVFQACAECHGLKRRLTHCPLAQSNCM